MDTTKNQGRSTQRRTAAGGNSVKRTGTKTAGTAAGKQRTAAPNRQRISAAPAQQGRTAQPSARKVRREERQAAAPEVVYTPAKPFQRGKFLVQLATVVAVVLAISFGISVFFRVENINVSGTVKYDPWTIKEASGIELGDNLLSFGEARAAGKIKTALPYVESVRIGIKLPNTVNIEIKELDVVYSIRDASDQWWLITAEGKVIDKTDSATAGDSTQILGVKLASPVVGQQAVAQEQAPPPTDATDETGETTPPVTVRAADQLDAALKILQYMEECGIIGQAASVDVTDLGNLELWYGQRFRVKLGDTTQLLYKIKCMNAAINGKDKENTLKEYDSGVLDITFTIKPNQVIYQADEN